MEHPTLDIENRLKEYFPILFELLDHNRINWRVVHRVFGQKHMAYMARKERTMESFSIEASLYNIITEALKKEPQAMRLLDFLQRLFKELSDVLSIIEKELILGNIYGLLTNIDLKYLNFVGELAVLNHLKHQDSFQLQETEYLLPNGNGSKIDFRFIHSISQQELCIEVVNIHLNEKNTSSDQATERLLHQKIGEKLNKKGIAQFPNCYLVPVLWGEYTEIKYIKSFYDRHSPLFPQTDSPSCFMTFTTFNQSRLHRFGSIHTIFANIIDA